MGMAKVPITEEWQKNRYYRIMLEDLYWNNNFKQKHKITCVLNQSFN